MKRIIKVYNEHHLGDQIFNFILFNIIKSYLEENDIHIEYYCNDEHHDQLSEFNYSKNIKIISINDPGDKGLRLWIGDPSFKINFYNYTEYGYFYNTFYVCFFNDFLKKVDIPRSIDKLEYTDPQIEERYKALDSKYNGKYSDLDFLILNSTPRSGQYDKDDNKWNKLINKLNLKYKIVTSEKTDGVNCTCDDKLTVKDIQAISAHSKKIIAVNSGVFTVLFNKDTLDNVNVVYSFSDMSFYDHPKIVNKKEIDDLNFLAEDPESFQTMEFNNSNTIFFLIIALTTFLLLNINISKVIRYIKNRIRAFNIIF